jgi:hypothetical protein
MFRPRFPVVLEDLPAVLTRLDFASRKRELDCAGQVCEGATVQ